MISTPQNIATGFIPMDYPSQIMNGLNTEPTFEDSLNVTEMELKEVTANYDLL